MATQKTIDDFEDDATIFYPEEEWQEIIEATLGARFRLA